MNQLGARVRVTSVKPIHDFKVKVVFDNGTSREIDLEKYLRGPIFDPLRTDPARFRGVKVEGGTLAWDNGADIDPDVLYYELEPSWQAETDTAPA